MTPPAYRLDPPLTLDEARALLEMQTAFDDVVTQVETLARVLRATGVCWCPMCRRERRGET